jgi:hypothetical protein
MINTIPAIERLQELPAPISPLPSFLPKASKTGSIISINGIQLLNDVNNSPLPAPNFLSF